MVGSYRRERVKKTNGKSSSNFDEREFGVVFLFDGKNVLDIFKDGFGVNIAIE